MLCLAQVVFKFADGVRNRQEKEILLPHWDKAEQDPRSHDLDG